MKIVLVTGGFDPIHSGHISYLNHAQHLEDDLHLVVGLNSDVWLERKKGRAFLPWRERMIILGNLHMVDEVIAFDDSDGSSVDAIQQVRARYPTAQIIFANGGDKTQHNIPEMDVVDSNLTFVFGVGGEDKKNSSSWILQEWKSPKTPRPWGYYRVLHEAAGVKVKELTVDPGKKLSMQRHQHRSELWFVGEGNAVVNWDHGSTHIKLHKQETINVAEWHQLENVTDQPLRIIEIQYGTDCTEEDIERR